MAFPKVDLIFDLGQLGSTILARLRTPFQEVPNDQILMPGHNTSYWRPAIERPGMVFYPNGRIDRYLFGFRTEGTGIAFYLGDKHTVGVFIVICGCAN